VVEEPVIGVTLAEIRALRYRPRVARYQPTGRDELVARLEVELAGYGYRRIPLVAVLELAPPSDVAAMLAIRWTEGGLDAAREIAHRTADRLLAPCVPWSVAELRAALDTGIPLTLEARARAYEIDDGPPDRRASAAIARLRLSAVVTATELRTASDLSILLSSAVTVLRGDEVARQRDDLRVVLSRPVEEPPAPALTLCASRVYAAHVDPGDLPRLVGAANDGDPVDVRRWVDAEPDTARALHLVTIAGGVDVVRSVARRAADRLREIAAVDFYARVDASRIDSVVTSDPLAAVAIVARHAPDRAVERAAQRADLLSLLSEVSR
jgi:hypothetical protein